jgi:hypothetical protein
MSNKLRSEKNCLNCGHFVADHFCSHCGQENIETKETFKHQLSHVIGDITHFDSKFLQTVKFLFTKPGLLTLEYLKGKRVRYVHPVRLFVFTSFLFFFFHSIIPDLHSNGDEHYKEYQLKEALKNAKTKDDSDELKKSYQLGNLLGKELSGKADKSQKTKIGDTSTKNISIVDNGFVVLSTDAGDSVINNTFNRNLNSEEDYKIEQDSLPKNKRDGYFLKKLKVFFINGKDKTPQEFIHEFFENFMHKMHYWIFLLFPFFALILKIVYRKKKFYYADHLIFGFHLHTIILLLLLINFTVSRLLDVSLTDWVYLGIFVYLFLSLKRIYNDSYLKTFFKSLLIYIFYSFFVLIFIVLAMGSLIFL